MTQKNKMKIVTYSMKVNNVWALVLEFTKGEQTVKVDMELDDADKLIAAMRTTVDTCPARAAKPPTQDEDKALDTLFGEK